MTDYLILICILKCNAANDGNNFFLSNIIYIYKENNTFCLYIFVDVALDNEVIPSI